MTNADNRENGSVYSHYQDLYYQARVSGVVNWYAWDSSTRFLDNSSLYQTFILSGGRQIEVDIGTQDC